MTPFELFEATDYRAMFHAFDAKEQKKIDEYIKWARTNLKKNDRIVWFLRWVRIDLAGLREKKPQDAVAAKQREYDLLNRRLNTSYSPYSIGYSDAAIGNLQTQLVHYLGLPIPKLQQIVWDKQSPNELLQTFKKIETEWKENSDERRLLKYEKGKEPRIVLQFPDGYAWFDLEDYSCDDEARAMGHCGNMGGNSSDTILSLRRLAKAADNRRYWYPMLTFILGSDGVLGEMKGRGNDKPAARYHPYIVALLRMPLITGIRGGGYKPENNFRLSDLDDETREELIEEKPDLGDVDVLYQKEGMTPRVLDRIKIGLQANGVPSDVQYVPEQKEFIVKSWRDFEQFMGDMYDDDVEIILNIALGETDAQLDIGNVKVEFYRALMHLPQQWQEKAFARAGVVKDRSASLEQVARYLSEHGDDWFVLFENVYNSFDSIKNIAWERLAEYVNAGWPFVGYVYNNLPNEVQDIRSFVLEKKPVYLTISEDEMVIYASSNSDDSDTDYELYQVRGEYGQSGWDNYDHENLKDWRREQDLVDKDGKDKWLASIGMGTKRRRGFKQEDRESTYLAEQFLSALQGDRSFGKVTDPNQQELSFESLRRLKKLSGFTL